MKRSFSKVLGLTVLAGMMLATTACGSSKQTNELVYWSVFTGVDGENMSRLVDEYNKTNPEFPVKHVPIEGDDLYAKIPTVVGSGKDVPDLTILHAERIAGFQKQGVVTDLNDYIKANGDIKAGNYIPEAWELGSIGGSQYGIPLDVHSFVTYYNEDLVNQYAPEILDDGIITFEEIIAASEKAEADGVVGLGITWMRVQYLSYLAQLNGSLSTDGTTPTLDSKEAIAVLESLEHMVEIGAATQDGDDPGQLFRSGQLMFWPEGIWMINSIKDIPDLNWKMTHMPVVEGGEQKNWTSSHQFAMLKNDKMTEERAAGVMAFVNYVGENGLEWAQAGQVPAHLSIRDNATFATMPQSFLLEDTSKLAISDYLHYGYAVEALDKVVYEVCFGRMSAQDAVEQMQKEASEKIQMAQ